MTRLINADSVYKWYLEAFKGQIKPNEIRFSMNDIRDNLENIPTIDAEPVRHGKWIETDEYDEYYGRLYRCSNCNTSVISDFDYYCPFCGSYMRGEK